MNEIWNEWNIIWNITPLCKDLLSVKTQVEPPLFASVSSLHFNYSPLHKLSASYKAVCERVCACLRGSGDQGGSRGWCEPRLESPLKAGKASPLCHHLLLLTPTSTSFNLIFSGMYMENTSLTWRRNCRGAGCQTAHTQRSISCSWKISTMKSRVTDVFIYFLLQFTFQHCDYPCKKTLSFFYTFDPVKSCYHQFSDVYLPLTLHCLIICSFPRSLQHYII